MRDYGFAAVRAAVSMQADAISSSRMRVAAGRSWFRVCNAVPALKRLTFGKTWAEQARARPWERERAAEWVDG